MDHYHNTTNETDKLDQYEQKAKTQDEKIFEYFKPFSLFSASYLFKMEIIGSAPLTSVRRSLTNLSKAGKLIKCEDQVKGMYGRNEHLYGLPIGQTKMEL